MFMKICINANIMKTQFSHKIILYIYEIPLLCYGGVL
jgi:hypothetical protein